MTIHILGDCSLLKVLARNASLNLWRRNWIPSCDGVTWDGETYSRASRMHRLLSTKLPLELLLAGRVW
jgi:hypothetical protein